MEGIHLHLARRITSFDDYVEARRHGDSSLMLVRIRRGSACLEIAIPLSNGKMPAVNARPSNVSLLP